MQNLLINSTVLFLAFTGLILAKEGVKKEFKEPSRVTQLKLLIKASNEKWLSPKSVWPKEFNSLFQGIRLVQDVKVTSKALHLKAVGSIPDRLMKGKVIKETIEVNGWYYSCIEPIGEAKPTWDRIVASKKGEKYLQFGFTW